LTYAALVPPRAPKRDDVRASRLLHDIGRVMHNIPVDLDPFTVTLPAGWQGNEVAVECLLHAQNQMEPMKTTGRIIIGGVEELEPWRTLDA